MKKILPRLLLSLASSALAVYLLSLLIRHSGGSVSMENVFNCVRRAVWPAVAFYAICQLVQTVLRALRNRILIRAGLAGGKRGKVPSLYHLSLVMFVRGACADMLPARVGELSYVAMLNRGYNLPVADCLSSLSIGLLMDFVALLIVLVSAIAAISGGLSLAGSAIVLALVCLVGWFGIFGVLPFFAKLCRRFCPEAVRESKLGGRLLKLLEDTAESVRFVSRERVAGRVVLVSAAIRIVKYLGLFLLFQAVTVSIWPRLAHAPIPSILIALISSEGAASLPVPSFMSFGSYEAGGLVALTALGFNQADSMVALLSMHLISQIIDYSLGLLAFLVFTWSGRESPAVEHPPCACRSAWWWAGLGGAATLFAAAFFAATCSVRAAGAEAGKGSSAEMTPIGKAEPASADMAAKWAALAKEGARVVWSSNRSGSHDLYLLAGGGPVRLTSAPFADTYPRFSPDGTLIAFSRSRETWVSQRVPEKWDTWILDLASGEEVKIAEHAFTACWEPSGSNLVYVLDGTNLVRHAVQLVRDEKGRLRNEGASSLLYSAGQGLIPGGVVFQTPDLNAAGELAVTFRSKANGTWVIRPGGAPEKIGGGCEIIWGDEGKSLLWVDHPGNLKNGFYTRKAGASGRELLLDIQGGFSHEYFPKPSADGKWIVYGASTGKHEHDTADYEIFLWRVGSPESEVIRLTWHTGNDCWPDVRF